MLSRSRSKNQSTSDETFSSIRTEKPLTVLIDDGATQNNRTATYPGIASVDHCLFIVGAWNCVGERCSSSSHRLEY